METDGLSLRGCFAINGFWERMERMGTDGERMGCPYEDASQSADFGNGFSGWGTDGERMGCPNELACFVIGGRSANGGQAIFASSAFLLMGQNVA